MVRLNFNNLSIKQISNASGVYSGKNIQISFTNTRKINEGIGTITGDKTLSINNRHVVMDQDTIDLFRKDNK